MKNENTFRINIVILFILSLFMFIIFKITSNICVIYLVSDNSISTQILSNNFCSEENNSDTKIDKIINEKYKNLSFVFSSKSICKYINNN